LLRNATQKGRLAVLAGCAAVALAAAGALRADLMVAHGFGRALGIQKAALPFETVVAGGRYASPAVGDEGFWLTRAEVESPAPFAKQLTVGDSITITDRDGRERKLEVIDLKPIGEVVVKTGAGSAAPRLLLVTCRIVGTAEREGQSPVRFIIEGEVGGEPAALPRPAAKAL
jgi:hypothetical protein